MSRARSIPRELPLKGLRHLLISGLDGRHAGFDFALVREVIPGQDLALHDRDVDLNLVEPGGMRRQVNQPQVPEYGP